MKPPIQDNDNERKKQPRTNKKPTGDSKTSKVTKAEQTAKGNEHSNVTPENLSQSEIEKQSEIIANAIIRAATETSKKKDATNIIGVAINAILAITTLFIFFINKKGIDAGVLSSQHNDSTSKATLEATKKYNDSTLKIQSDAFNENKKYNGKSLGYQDKTFKGNNFDSKERFKRDTQSMNLQIKALIQNQEQFLKQNEPYLQVYIDSLHFIGNREIFTYTLVNLTPIPVKIINLKSLILNRPSEPVEKNVELFPSSDINYYVIKESPQTRNQTVNDPLSDNEIKWLKDSYHSAYWKAEFTYQNLISNKIKTYKFFVKITLLKSKVSYPDFISNINE